MRLHFIKYLAILVLLIACDNQIQTSDQLSPIINYQSYSPDGSELVVSRAEYRNKLHGFWLAQSIANWTGLVTEMDKIGNMGDIKTGEFYTRDDWGQPDQPSIWGEGVPSALSPTIDFVFEDTTGVWGADDDTDIEYIYQHLLFQHKTAILSGEQIRDGWMTHIKKEEENYLWVSNQTALDLMYEGLLPPATGDPRNNPDFEMIDAQLTTEIFGLFSPTRPDFALKMALLPIQNVARNEAQEIAEFYVIMYSLSVTVNSDEPINDQLKQIADTARKHLDDDGYPAEMYDFVKQQYELGFTWEETRDDLYTRYQVNQLDGYDITSKNLYCNGCFAAGINFAASLVSLFYGEGDLKETIKIGALAGWDSDNPTATWAGMLGFILGVEGVEKAFDRSFSEQFYIHRTRQGFANDGFDTFSNMAQKGLFITDMVIQEHLGGGIDLPNDQYFIPTN